MNHLDFDLAEDLGVEKFFTFFPFLAQDKGEKVAKGHKASFCLEDTKCDPGFDKRFNCSVKGGQGISPGCYDIYNWRIDCQWVDCTDFPHGSFYLRVHLNPGNQVAESDFRNNVAKCKIHDYGNFVICDKCWIGKIISVFGKFYLHTYIMQMLQSDLLSDRALSAISITQLVD